MANITPHGGVIAPSVCGISMTKDLIEILSFNSSKSPENVDC